MNRNRGGRRQSDEEYSLLLGEILGKVDATEKHIAHQNGTLAKVDDTTTKLALKMAQLPCDLQAERLKNHIKHCENNGITPKIINAWVHRGSGAGVATVIIIAIFQFGHMVNWW